LLMLMELRWYRENLKKLVWLLKRERI